MSGVSDPLTARMALKVMMSNSYAIVQMTPPALKNIGWRYYIIFMVLNALFVPVIYFYYPGTSALERRSMRELILIDHRRN